MEANHVDIAISGGGVVGGLAGLLLARACPQLSIAVLDGSEHNHVDPRTLALAHTTVVQLQKAGIFQTTQLKEAATAIQHIHVSERNGAGSTVLHADNFDLNAMGYVVSAQTLQEVIATACKNYDNLNWMQQTRLKGARYEQSQVTLDLAQWQGNLSAETTMQQAALKAKLVVAADGNRSFLREHLKIGLREESYSQVAFIATVTLDRDHNQWAYERFTEQGPIALLPSGPRQMALVWCVHESKAEQVRALHDDDFLRTLQTLFGHRAGRFVSLSQRASYPLNLLLAQRVIYHRTAFIGNACHTLHPIAGQGYNLGVRDAVDLAACVQRDWQAGDFSHASLLHYEQLRQTDYNRIVTLTDGLVRLFSNRDPALVATRNLGLLAMRQCDAFSYPLARAAMGYRGLVGEQ